MVPLLMAGRTAGRACSPCAFVFSKAYVLVFPLSSGQSRALVLLMTQSSTNWAYVSLPLPFPTSIRSQRDTRSIQSHQAVAVAIQTSCMDIGFFFQQESNCFDDLLVRDWRSRRLSFTVQLPIFRHHLHSQGSRHLLQIPTVQRLRSRHIHSTLLHVLNLPFPHGTEIRMGHSSLLKTLELNIEPGHLLHRRFPNVRSQLGTNLAEHFNSFLGDSSSLGRFPKRILVHCPTRRSVLEG